LQFLHYHLTATSLISAHEPVIKEGASAANSLGACHLRKMDCGKLPARVRIASVAAAARGAPQRGASRRRCVGGGGGASSVRRPPPRGGRPSAASQWGRHPRGGRIGQRRRRAAPGKYIRGGGGEWLAIHGSMMLHSSTHANSTFMTHHHILGNITKSQTNLSQTCSRVNRVIQRSAHFVEFIKKFRLTLSHEGTTHCDLSKLRARHTKRYMNGGSAKKASISLTLNCGRAMGLVWSGCYCSLPSLPFHFRASPVLALSLPTPPPTGSDRSDGEACGLRGGCFGWEGHNDRRGCRTLQPFSQKPRTPTVAKECQIGLYDPAEGDLELFCNSCGALR